MQAGFAIFAERGFLRTTASEIVERADLGHGTFYQYFRSKEDLLLELIGEAVGSLDQQLPRPKEQGATPHQALRPGIAGILHWFGTHRGILLALWEALRDNPGFAKAWEPGRAALAQWTADCIEWGEQQGVYRGMDREWAVDVTLSLLVGAASDVTLGERWAQHPDLEQVADRLATYCGNALFETRSS